MSNINSKFSLTPNLLLVGGQSVGGRCIWSVVCWLVVGGQLVVCRWSVVGSRLVGGFWTREYFNKSQRQSSEKWNIV